MSSDMPMTAIFSSSTSTSPLYWSVAVTTVPFLISVRIVFYRHHEGTKNTKRHEEEQVNVLGFLRVVFVTSCLRGCMCRLLARTSAKSSLSCLCRIQSRRGR